MCCMALGKKPKWRECYCIGFHLYYILALQVQKMCIYGHYTGAVETYFFSKKLKTLCIGKSIGIGKSHQYELVTRWKWTFMSNLYSRLPSTHAWFLHTLGAHKLMSKKLWQLLWDVFLLTKNNIQFQKDNCCLWYTLFKFRKTNVPLSPWTKVSFQ